MAIIFNSLKQAETDLGCFSGKSNLPALADSGSVNNVLGKNQNDITVAWKGPTAKTGVVYGLLLSRLSTANIK